MMLILNSAEGEWLSKLLLCFAMFEAGDND